jgi:hypothetical protein
MGSTATRRRIFIANDPGRSSHAEEFQRPPDPAEFFRQLVSAVPEGNRRSAHWFAILLCSAAFVAMLRYKIDIIPVIIGAGILGLLHNSIRG